jgi:predicted transposase YbfD/YdcC
VLRHIEDLARDMLRFQSAPPGLERRVSDTTLDRLLGLLQPEAFEPILHQQVKAVLKKGLVTHDAFAGKILTIVGKACDGECGEAPCASCRTLQDREGNKYWYVYTLRAALTSSSACPVLGQQVLESKEGEATAFPQLLEQMVTLYGSHFDYVTADAGMTSADNARAVRKHKKHYLFALKKNHPRLFNKAFLELANAPMRVRTLERARGADVERALRVVDMPEGEDFPDARQILWVRQKTFRPGRLPVTEWRLFITSIPRQRMSDERLLQWVRRHWGIEHGANWTADVILKEDTASPSYRGQAPMVLSWLRTLAYNLAALVRTHLPRCDKRPASYHRTLEVLYQALLGLPVLPECLLHLA